MSAVRLHLAGVHKTYGQHHVLTDLELALAPGEVVSVRGASGTGKSTLLNIAGLLDQPDSGDVRLDGQVVSSASARERAHVRATRIGFVFQSFHLLPEFSVIENILMPARTAKADLNAVRQHAEQLLLRVGLSDKRDRDIQTLSGGEAQRIALCRALVLKPDLVLADEPTGNLDPGTADSVLGLLLDLVRDEGASVLLVTHDPRIAERADRCLELHGGGLREATATS